MGDPLRHKKNVVGQVATNLRYASNFNQNVSVFDRVALDRKTPFKDFAETAADKYKNLFNPDRRQALGAQDAMTIP